MQLENSNMQLANSCMQISGFGAQAPFIQALTNRILASVEDPASRVTLRMGSGEAKGRAGERGLAE
jgi:hypothetical protein